MAQKADHDLLYVVDILSFFLSSSLTENDEEIMEMLSWKKGELSCIIKMIFIAGNPARIYLEENTGHPDNIRLLHKEKKAHYSNGMIPD